jgi:hypothetical protein
MNQLRNINGLGAIVAGLILVMASGCATTGLSGDRSGAKRADNSTADVAVNKDVIQFSNFSSGPESHILVIDPIGRKIGYDLENGVELNEIPAGNYSGQAVAQQVSIRNPIAGSYTFVIGGSHVGAFEAGITYAEDKVLDSRDFRGEIQDGNAFYAIIDLNPESREPLQFSVFQYN